MSIHDLKERLSDVPGIGELTMQMIAGRQVFGWDGLIAAVDPQANDAEIEYAIRTASITRTSMLGRQIEIAMQDDPRLPIPAIVPRLPEPTTVQGTKAMAAPTGSFAASIKAMLDGARAGVAQARTDGLAKVGDAVSKLKDAETATNHVAGKMAETINSEAADVMAELGQISNDLGLD